MRYSLTLGLLAAIGAQAAPQASYSVQPISQISDGQIQAPPATAIPSMTAVVPSVSASVVPTEVPIPSVVPSISAPVVVPSGNASVPVVVPSGTGSSPSGASNGTAVTTSGPSATAGGSGAPSAPAGTGAAAANMVSFGGLALAVAGFVLA